MVKELGFVPMGIDNVDRWVGGVVVSRKADCVDCKLRETWEFVFTITAVNPAPVRESSR